MKKKASKKANIVSEPEASLMSVELNVPRAESWVMELGGKRYAWATKMERVSLIREGLPYTALELVSRKAGLPVKQLLQLFQIPQTTYNKRLRDGSRLSARDSEMVLVLYEVLAYGQEVFNQEEDKFQRWIRRPNISLGATAPEALFDSLTGIQEVRKCLQRIDYGVMA